MNWFVNNQPLNIGSRIKSINDFGLIILEICPVYPEDSGTYKCTVKNSYGEDSCEASLRCLRKANVISNSQLPSHMSGAQAKIDILDAPKPVKNDIPDQVLYIYFNISMHMNFVSSPTIQFILFYFQFQAYSSPKFLSQLQTFENVAEGELVHFECRVEPAADPNLKIDWLHDGKPICYSKT